MKTVADILNFLETIAPAREKMDWDNVGLLCGERQQPVTKILVALDPFLDVCQEAVEMGAELIVTHHPLIFRPLKAVTAENPVGAAVRYLIRQGISAVNAHTNLDCAPDGVNDCLAQALGLSEIRVLNPTGADEQGREWGLLRAGTVEEQPLPLFLSTVKGQLRCPGLRYVDSGRPVRRVAVGGGSCGDELEAVIRNGCDTFVTADVKYNQFWDARELGVNLIDAGHFYTENPVCAVLAEKLRSAFPMLSVEISQKHRDCMKFFPE